jgi:hypothetical protein
MLDVRCQPLAIMSLRLLLAATISSSAMVALGLVVRRLAGALSTPLDFLPALGLGLLFSMIAWLLRRASLAAVDAGPLRQRTLVAMTAVLWTLVVSLTLFSTSPLAVLALWLPVIACECAWRVLDSGDVAPPQEIDQVRGGGTPPLRSPGTVQNLVRTRAAGHETISGMVCFDFAAGEQTTAIHLPFSPPLASDPEVEVESDAAEVAVRVTDCRSYGLRIEAKRGRDTAAALSVYAHIEVSANS